MLERDPRPPDLVRGVLRRLRRDGAPGAGDRDLGRRTSTSRSRSPTRAGEPHGPLHRAASPSRRQAERHRADDARAGRSESSTRSADGAGRATSRCSPAASPTPAATRCRSWPAAVERHRGRARTLELIWASPRELLNIFQADAIGCHIITVTNDILKKLPLVGKDLDEYSLETVKMFYDDAARPATASSGSWSRQTDAGSCGSCRCARCRGDLDWSAEIAHCTPCSAAYEVADGIRSWSPARGRVDDPAEGRAGGVLRREDSEFEISRPHGAPALYGRLLEEKFRRGVSHVRSGARRQRVLVVCGGSGMDAEFLARTGASVVTSDISLGAARRARQRAERYGLSLRAVVADVERLPFRTARSTSSTSTTGSITSTGRRPASPRWRASAAVLSPSTSPRGRR